MPLDAATVAVRLRRLWLDDVAGSDEFLASDLAGEGGLTLRRVGHRLLVSGPISFGDGDPFDSPLGPLVRSLVAQRSEGAVSEVTWRPDELAPTLRRARSTDLDILGPEDPPTAAYGLIAGHLRRALPVGLSDGAHAVLARLRVAAVSRHRLWFATATDADARAIGSVPGARAGLVQAVQRYQGHEVPLYRVIVDPELGSAGPSLGVSTRG